LGLYWVLVEQEHAVVSEPKVTGVSQLVDGAVPRNCEHNLNVRAGHPWRVVKHDYAIYIEEREWLSSFVQAIDNAGSHHIWVGSS
jgi:hypothetical protein